MSSIIKLFTLALFFSYVLIPGARGQDTKKKKEIAFDYPDDIKENDKLEFVKQFTKGIKLYKLNCAKCHSTKKDGKEVIPDFSLPQLLDYEIRVQYPEHQDDLRETNVTKEELDMIVLFLQYKKRNEPTSLK